MYVILNNREKVLLLVMNIPKVREQNRVSSVLVHTGTHAENTKLPLGLQCRSSTRYWVTLRCPLAQARERGVCPFTAAVGGNNISKYIRLSPFSRSVPYALIKENVIHGHNLSVCTRQIFVANCNTLVVVIV